jgi:hypothetical protein
VAAVPDSPDISLDLAELSALTLRPGEGGAELVAVSDDAFDLLLVAAGADGSLGDARRADLEPALPDEVVDGGGSEFEGVACDGAGRVVLLQEESARILVLSPGLSALERMIDLEVDRDAPGIGKGWRKHPNARGEGMLLLRGGHVVVAKQKDPVALIEFGPRGDAPLGLGRDALLPPGEDLALPGGAEPYAALDWWELDEAGTDAFESINDLAVGADGRVLLLSASSGRIARLEGAVRPGAGSAAVAEAGDLPIPDDADGRPEALAVLPDGRLAVGLDARGTSDVWVLDSWP